MHDIARILADPHATAREAAARGQKVVGFVSNTVPMEIALAAGMLPVQLTPRPGPTPHADEVMESLFDPMVRSIFDQLLGGELDFLEAVVLPRAWDSAQRTYYYLCELRRVGAYSGPAPLLYDVQKLQTPSSADYTLRRTADFAAEMGRLAGKTIDDADLSNAVTAVNRMRDAFVQFGRRRTRVRGLEALNAMSAALTMPPDAAAALIANVPFGSEPLRGVKTILIGSAHASAELHTHIERAGGHVVGDYHWRGDLFFGPPIPATEPTLAALASHYARHAFSSRDFPANIDALTSFAKARGAEAAIFFFYAQEEALVWDCPAQQRALEAAGVRTLVLSQQSYPVTEAVLGPLTKFYAGRQA